MKRHFRVKKETPELKVGAILIEACNNGDQAFDHYKEGSKHIKYPFDKTHGDSITYARQVVLQQPEWFEEVFMIEVPQSKLKAVRKLVSK